VPQKRRRKRKAHATSGETRYPTDVFMYGIRHPSIVPVGFGTLEEGSPPGIRSGRDRWEKRPVPGQGYRPFRNDSPRPGNELSSILLEEGGEEIVVLLLVREDLVEEELGGLVPLLRATRRIFLYIVIASSSSFLSVSSILLQRGADEDRGRLRGGIPPR